MTTNPEATEDQPKAATAPTPPTGEQVDASAKASLALFTERVLIVLGEFEAYRTKAQSGSLTADDEKRAEVATVHLREIVETHRPLPPLPQALATQ